MRSSSPKMAWVKRGLNDAIASSPVEVGRTREMLTASLASTVPLEMVSLIYGDIATPEVLG